MDHYEIVQPHAQELMLNTTTLCAVCPGSLHKISYGNLFALDDLMSHPQVIHVSVHLLKPDAFTLFPTFLDPLEVFEFKAEGALQQEKLVFPG